MNFEKIKTLKLVIFALLCCPTVTVQSKQLLHIGTPKCHEFFFLALCERLLHFCSCPIACDQCCCVYGSPNAPAHRITAPAQPPRLRVLCIRPCFNKSEARIWNYSQITLIIFLKKSLFVRFDIKTKNKIFFCKNSNFLLKKVFCVHSH